MQYHSLLFVAFGTLLLVVTTLRLRGIIAEGLYEHYNGRISKISRVEQPRSYWSRLTMMFAIAAAGAFMMAKGVALTHI